MEKKFTFKFSIILFAQFRATFLVALLKGQNSEVNLSNNKLLEMNLSYSLINNEHVIVSFPEWFFLTLRHILCLLCDEGLKPNKQRFPTSFFYTHQSYSLTLLKPDFLQYPGRVLPLSYSNSIFEIVPFFNALSNVLSSV